jgi:hypothetical protein
MATHLAEIFNLKLIEITARQFSKEIAKTKMETNAHGNR